MNWLLARLGEKSTWLGITGLFGVATQVAQSMPGQVDTAGQLAEATNVVSQVGSGVMTGDYAGAAVAALAGIGSMFFKEKGRG